MERTSAPAVIAAGLLFGLAGCNQIAGIHEATPRDEGGAGSGGSGGGSTATRRG